MARAVTPTRLVKLPKQGLDHYLTIHPGVAPHGTGKGQEIIEDRAHLRGVKGHSDIQHRGADTFRFKPGPKAVDLGAFAGNHDRGGSIDRGDAGTRMASSEGGRDTFLAGSDGQHSATWRQRLLQFAQPGNSTRCTRERVSGGP